MLLQMSSCPFCMSGENTPCFATYDDGYKCFTCGKHKTEHENSRCYTPAPHKYYIAISNCTSRTDLFPTWAEAWLYTYYLFDEDIRALGIAYKEDIDALVFPVFDTDDNLLFYQTRTKDKQFRTYGDKSQHMILGERTSPVCVIVEDFISAARVSKIDDTAPLFGTSLAYKRLKAIVAEYEYIIVWLDSDDAGQKAGDKIYDDISKEISRLQRERPFAKPKEVYRIETKYDPKTYTDKQIKEFINKTLGD